MPGTSSVPSSGGILLHLSKLKQLQPVGAAASRVFAALDNDPHGRLEPERAGALEALPPGEYQIAAILIGIHGAVANPEVHVDWGAGFGAADGRVALIEVKPGIHVGTLTITRPIQGLRLDPSNRNGKLVVGPVWIQPARQGNAVDLPIWRRFLLALQRRRAPSAQRCARKAALLMPAAGSASALAIAELALADTDRAAIEADLRARFLKLAGAAAPEQVARHPDWRGPAEMPVDASRSAVKAVAFYLPQFHTIPENDRWWGEGFTEWRNVKRATPQFVGHRQPRRPADLGYYDLRDGETMRRQIAMAKGHGLYGFCFHHYWFDGKRLLELPVDRLLADPTLEMPFCLCWANENWTRRWDGAEHEILMAQNHSPEDDLAFFADLTRYLRDPRYIKVDGKPLVIVYRPALLPDAAATAARWRKKAMEAGFPGLFLAATNAFGFSDPCSIGFDALIEFPPYTRAVPLINERLTFYNPDYGGVVHEYADIMRAAAVASTAGAIIIPGAMPGWDNEARRPGRGKVIHGATPERFAHWLNACFTRARETAPAGRRFVFVNAWNEWAEAAYLEPDTEYGFAFLRAVAEAVAAEISRDG